MANGLGDIRFAYVLRLASRNTAVSWQIIGLCLVGDVTGLVLGGIGGRALMVDVKILCGSAADMFVVVDGVRIARRGYAGTSQAGTWVSLESGWEVVDDGRRNTIAIKHNGVSVHYDVRG
jgi:hypothetical protein